jgi:hypothetical protein
MNWLYDDFRLGILVGVYICLAFGAVIGGWRR